VIFPLGVINENLRQQCVWKQAETTLKQDGAKLWWQHIIEFTPR